MLCSTILCCRKADRFWTCPLERKRVDTKCVVKQNELMIRISTVHSILNCIFNSTNPLLLCSYACRQRGSRDNGLCWSQSKSFMVAREILLKHFSDNAARDFTITLKGIKSWGEFYIFTKGGLGGSAGPKLLTIFIPPPDICTATFLPSCSTGFHKWGELLWTI